MNGKPFTDGGLMADVWGKKLGQWQVLARRSAPQQQISDDPKGAQAGTGVTPVSS